MSDRERWLHTPEGIPLRYTLATLPTRAVAFVVDWLLILAILFVLSLARIVAGDSAVFDAVFALIAFGLRMLYFPLFELAWRGQTPGKRQQRLRTVSTDGGPLTVRTVFARNLTREFELFLPLMLLLTPEAIYGPASSGLTGLLSVGWVVLFIALPGLNRDTLRVGDMLAGTRVVQLPELKLLADQSQHRPAGAAIEFSDAELGHYGTYELQVLEGVLRDEQRVDHETLRQIAHKISRRLGRANRPSDPEAFLRAFYAAQRAHLERGLLFGQKRADKRAARDARG